MRVATAFEPRPPAPDAASHADLARLARLVRGALGIDLQPFKSGIVQQRLAGRIAALGLSGFGAYLDLLEQPDSDTERDVLISAITTNVTQFFREAHHFDLLERRVLPDLVARARAGGRVRIWSAGCSSGQEPYSIAACILDLCPEAPRLDIKVLATDVDAHILVWAQRATYPEEEAQRLPAARRAALFGPAPLHSQARVRDDVVGLVAFKRLNLVDPWPMRRPCDAIFCRNVAIYFDPDVRERLWQRFLGTLADGGWLFIGHSERVLGPALAQVEHAGVTTYRKRPEDRPAAPHSGS